MPTASCHCGSIRLSFPTLRLETRRRCDCSICLRRGAVAVTVREDELTLVSGSTLRLYQFNTMTAEHYFCGVCGIYTHHRRRSNPKEFGVNLGCVEGAGRAELSDIPWEDGVNHPNDRK